MRAAEGARAGNGAKRRQETGEEGWVEGGDEGGRGGRGGGGGKTETTWTNGGRAGRTIAAGGPTVRSSPPGCTRMRRDAEFTRIWQRVEQLGVLDDQFVGLANEQMAHVLLAHQSLHVGRGQTERILPCHKVAACADRACFLRVEKVVSALCVDLIWRKHIDDTATP